MDAKGWNGDPEAQHDPGRAGGRPEVYRCLDCRWIGAGALAKHDHWVSGRLDGAHHQIVFVDDPRPSPVVTER